MVRSHAGGVTRAGRDLVGQHLDHDRRLKPGVGDEGRIHSGRLLRNFEAGEALMDLSPALVGKAGPELADRHKLVFVAVVDAGEQGACAELCPLAFAPVVAE